MTRVTRSKKIEVAEDETAVQMAIQLPANEDQHFNALSENTMTTNAMPTAPTDPLTTELNGLKAAFRTAIGVTKKGRKGKGRKKAGQQEASIDVEESEASAPANPVPAIASLNIQEPEGMIFFQRIGTINLTSNQKILSMRTVLPLHHPHQFVLLDIARQKHKQVSMSMRFLADRNLLVLQSCGCIRTSLRIEITQAASPPVWHL